ncbi:MULTISPECIES: arsenic resistance protein [unclassified Halomonas]|uniref:arsenic resistance protein n=1 Tax=unclassified Halomonas TaxID=2609666 RepID=UPI0007D956F3|nr:MULTISPECIES: arsenic resistance protein [unclassified Halomonas]MBT2786369.1 arsenic resistance protein [Halomonas sp. ISL-106]MBT2797391.1 arsenic resistance protein [Halomonas sp. ISL-104]OAL58757.1 sodium:proton symporter [Halomonas sp. ALS9]
MLTLSSHDRLPAATLTSSLLVMAIIIGALLGHFAPVRGQWLGDNVDTTLLTMIGLLFFSVRLNVLAQQASNLRFIAIAMVANFIVVPLIGYGVASLFMSAHPLLMVGLVIYFMSPCTDWFLGFTRLAGGNVALGMALIPVNMALQLLLYPVYLQWFTPHTGAVDPPLIATTLLYWFLLPVIAALTLHHTLRFMLGEQRFEQCLTFADRATPWVIALLVLQIFAGNIASILAHRYVFAWLLLSVFVFFVLTFVLSEAISRGCRLDYPEHALLTMTIAARNAPLMLAVTMTVLPGQPLIYAALVIGMLVEFPHLTLLRRILLALRRRRAQASSAVDSPS